MVIELLVLNGEDAGRLFTLGRDDVPVARVNPKQVKPGAILLSDPSVSLRQAKFVRDGDDFFIEHHQGATNPTTVNGKPVLRERIRSGDKIGMGRVVFEVRERQTSFSGNPSPERKAGVDRKHSSDVDRKRGSDVDRKRGSGATHVTVPDELLDAIEAPPDTEKRPIPGPRAQLTLLSGPLGDKPKVFDIISKATKIGRSSQCQITIPEGGVSRLHAEIVLEGDDFILIHRSGTNSTSVNGKPVRERMALYPGDHIQLADRIMLVFDRTEEARAPADSLWRRMEDEIERDREIEREFGVFGSFLDIHVVATYEMKSTATSPGHIVVSFERWRAWVGKVLEALDGEMLNSNGDELKCFFASPYQAVRAASRVLSDLYEFNAIENLLSRPFEVRMGIHTGHSLVDRSRGVAYSAVLDLATHLQQQSPLNALTISAETREKLPDGLPFEAAGQDAEVGLEMFRLSGPID